MMNNISDLTRNLQNILIIFHFQEHYTTNSTANSVTVPFGDYSSASFDHTHLLPVNIMHGVQHVDEDNNDDDNEDEDDQVVHDSTNSTQSLGGNYINLDLTI